MGLALFTKASGTLLMGWGHRAPSREGLSPGRKVNSESLCAPGNQPEKERERERMIDMGRPSGFGKRGPKALFFKRYFYTLPYTYMEMKDARSYRVSSFVLIKTRIFLHTFFTNDVVYSIFWPWRPVNILWPSFDKGCSTRKLIFPQSVFSFYF